MTERRRLFAFIAGLLALAGVEAGEVTFSALAQPAFVRPPVDKAVPAPELLHKVQRRGPLNFFDFLFGPDRARRPRTRVHRPPSRVPQRNTPTVEQLAVPKDPNAQRVYVFGDAFAAGLATGLTAAFAETPTIEVFGRAKPNSGVVRNDYYDWNAALAEILASEKVDIAVVIIGSNDRQAMRLEDGSSEPARSEKWEQIYISRVDALLRQFSEKGIPVYWVGLPIMRSQAYAQDMAYLNEVFLARAQRAGGKFIDTWERFADEEGRYSASGPDVNGKIRTLRADNGINMTGTGNKKLAFFVEQVLGADLQAGGLARLTNLGPGESLEGLRGPVEVELSLTSPQTPPENATLAGAAPRREEGEGAIKVENPRPDYKLLVLGESPQPQAGRADDFSWPRGNSKQAPNEPDEQAP